MPSLPNFIDPLIPIAVVFATACTDAVYVMFTNAVVRRRRLLARESLKDAGGSC